MVKVDEKVKLDDTAFEKQYLRSVKQGSERLSELPKATLVRYDAKSKRIVLEMENGVTLFVPANLIQGLTSENDADLGDLHLMMHGTQIHWDALDVQFYVEDLLKGVFGTPRWMQSLNGHLAEIGSKGGSSRSVAKSIASRENGKKGGRPIKRVA